MVDQLYNYTDPYGQEIFPFQGMSLEPDSFIGFAEDKFPIFYANYSFKNSSGPAHLVFQNRSDEFHEFFSAYCLNPPNDTCLFPGRCVNPDAAGALVRTAAYLSVFFLGNLLQFDEGEIEGTFSTHMMYVYSILISAAISISKQKMTIFHSEVIAMILGSPLTFSLFIYAILGTFGHDHRAGLNKILGPLPNTRVYRLLAVGGFVIWLAGVIYMELPSNHTKFAQYACDYREPSDALFLLSVLPYFSMAFIIHWATSKDAHGRADASPLILAIPVGITLLAVIVSIFVARKELFGSRTKDSKKGFISSIWSGWNTLREKFPFLHWMGVHVLPVIYWIFMTEFTIYLDSDGYLGHDNHFELSYGQILAILVILQPLWANLVLLFSKNEEGKSRFIFWFINLRWIQFLTCRPPLKRRTKRMERGSLEDYELGRPQIPLSLHEGSESSMKVKVNEGVAVDRDSEWR
ncbi:hypothetical protein DL96DRAFT_1617668 [Flagelloscypha sp. PMI_526]|nr:hypothetical protein DL96DRAFT_1617668 [Flagelloscypha sp. PMI_526]